MRSSTTLTALTAATIAGVNAQRPKDQSICDYYTTALLKENTAENQATLLTLLVNTVVIGNYTQPNVGIKVPGILAAGKFNNMDVNLLPYFDGTLASTNRGGDAGISVNFLDGGGAEPLMMSKPANDQTSNQYFLLTHLYEFFGSLLGCSMQGMAGYSAYEAEKSMYEVHKFMGLGPAELGYFDTQVGMAAASFGVAEADVTAVGTALNSLFGFRCSPETTVIKAQGPALQAICIEEACPIAPTGATCDSYAAVVEPTTATESMAPSATDNGTMPPTTAMPTDMTMAPSATHSTSAMPTAAAVVNGVNLAAVVAGIFAYMI